ncbi:MarR family winged helix-turn-helix transcriptional regulator [Rhizobium sp. No.120]
MKHTHSDRAELFWGERLRRIADHLDERLMRYLVEAQIPLQPAQLRFLAAVDDVEAATVTDLAKRVGITQPGISRMLAPLTRKGLITSDTPENDQRRRVVSLTKTGQVLVEKASRVVWPQVIVELRELCEGSIGTFPEQLSALENRLLSTAGRGPFRALSATAGKNLLDGSRDNIKGQSYD